MRLFLDSAKIDEIRHGLEMWDLDGVTTNPKHVMAAGASRMAVYRQIAELTAGTGKPVSVEVNPHLTDWREMVEEATTLAGLAPNFVVKIGASETGFKAIRELTAQGVKTNATLIFSVAQAWHAARSGATYISPFLGWKEAHGDNATTLIPEIVTMLFQHEYPSQIIAAAIRNSRQLAQAAVDGAHCATAGMAVYQESFQNPYTNFGDEVFRAAWDQTEQ